MHAEIATCKTEHVCAGQCVDVRRQIRATTGNCSVHVRRQVSLYVAHVRRQVSVRTHWALQVSVHSRETADEMAHDCAPRVDCTGSYRRCWRRSRSLDCCVYKTGLDCCRWRPSTPRSHLWRKNTNHVFYRRRSGTSLRVGEGVGLKSERWTLKKSSLKLSIAR